MNHADINVALNAQRRARLAALSDLLIPAGAGLPSASEADVQGNGVDQVLSVRADLTEPLAAALSDAADEPHAVLERWQRGASPHLETIRFVVSAAYFINPRVRELLGYPGQAPIPNPALPNEADSFLEDGILDAVRQRGPTYRPTPQA